MTKITAAIFAATLICSASAFAEKVEMPNVNYPAAFVMEGGKGNPWLDNAGTKHTPAWRLYLCFEKTTQPTSGQFVLDFSKLGNAIEETWSNSSTNEILFTERLIKVVLNYTYETKLTDNSATNYGYAFGKVNVKVQSQQDWELIYQAPNYNVGPRQSYEDMDFFNMSATGGSLVKFGQYTYTLNGEQYYISKGLDRFTYSKKDNRLHVVEVCENANQPYVLQIGSEITPIK